MERPKVDLVLEGGGVKGVGLVGAIARITEEYDVARVAGSSVGALVGSMVAAGYQGDELWAEIGDFPFPKVPNRDLLDRVPLAGPLLSITLERGVYETDYVRDYLADRLAAKGVRTFGDLDRPDPEASLLCGWNCKLVVTATDLTAGELLYLPWHFDTRLGLPPAEQSVADAVAASIAIPFYFEPSRITDADGTQHILVDGGVLSNFPVSAFDRIDADDPRWPTFGIKILPFLPAGLDELMPVLPNLPVPGWQQFLSLVATTFVGRDQMLVAHPSAELRSFSVDTSAVGVVEFDLSDEQKQQLYDEGWSAADEFLGQWDWGIYQKTCPGVCEPYQPPTPPLV